jgi:hypothetical protein
VRSADGLLPGTPIKGSTGDNADADPETLASELLVTEVLALL